MNSEDKKRFRNGITSREFWDRIWKAATRGHLIYLTGSIILIAVLLSAVVGFLDNSTKIIFQIKAALKEQTSALSKHELEVCNEWVAVIDYGSTYQQARDRADRFQRAFEGADKHGKEDDWRTNTLVVRDITDPSRWIVVVDAWGDQSEKEIVSNEIKEMQDFYPHRSGHEPTVLPETMGMWLYGVEAINYRMDEFEKTYGRLIETQDCPTYLHHLTTNDPS